MDLSALQNLCKRDPEGYREEFLLQLRHFESQLKIFQLKPSSNFKTFQEQINFLSHVALCYPKDLVNFPNSLSQLLEQHCNIMEPELRKTLTKALILLRNRGLINHIEVLSLFFKLFRCPDKQLRALLYRHIVSDIRKLNSKSKNNKTNNTLQNFMFTMLQDTNEVAAKKALDITIELYQKKIWNDAKTVNAISTAAFSKNTKVVVATLQFFLGGPEEEEGSDDEEEKKKKPSAKELYQKFSAGGKKTKAKLKKMKHELAKLKKSKKKVQSQPNFPAIELIHDPQGYTEKLFNLLKKTTEKFDTRLMLMNLISRLISVHKLLVLNFYPFLQKFMQPKQQNITYLLAILAQSCHEIIPPETLEPIIKVLADNFVSDRSSNEVVCIGINTIREICTRTPLAMEGDLLQDLVQYKNHKDKGVVMAARSLINLYRTINPSLLHKKDRGKDHDRDAVPLSYGQVNIVNNIADVELLEEYERRKLNGELDDFDLDDEEEEEGWEGWENDDDDDDNDQESDEGEWLDLDENGKIILNEEDLAEDDDDNDNLDNDDNDDEEDDEENEDEEEENEEEEEENEEDGKEESNSLPLAATRIITQEEWEIIEKLKKKGMTTDATKKRRRDSTDSTEENNALDFVDPSAIEGYRKKQKANKEERLAAIRGGREGREYGSKKKFQDKKGGSTNEEKLKSKPFMLVKFKREIQEKKKRSTKEQQRVKSSHSKTMRNQKKFKH